MFKVKFYDEAPFKLIPPKSYKNFKEKISTHYGFSIEDSNEFMYSYDTKEMRKYLKTDEDYSELLNYLSKTSKEYKMFNLEIYLEINEESKIYKEILPEVIAKNEDKNEIELNDNILDENRNKTSENNENILAQSIKIQVKPDNIFEEVNKSKSIYIPQTVEKVLEKELIKENENVDFSIINNSQQQEISKYQNIDNQNNDINIENEKQQDSEYFDKVLSSQPEEISKQLDNTNISNLDESRIEQIISRMLNDKMNCFKNEIISTLNSNNKKEKKVGENREKKGKSKDKFKDKANKKEKHLEKNLDDAKEIPKLINSEQNLSENLKDDKKIKNKEKKVKKEAKSRSKPKKCKTKEKELISEDLKLPLEKDSVNIKNNEKEIPQIIHYNVSCDRCKIFPITGIRYKCYICYDYDLCETCEANSWKEHNHPMIKMRESQFKENFECPFRNNYSMPQELFMQNFNNKFVEPNKEWSGNLYPNKTPADELKTNNHRRGKRCEFEGQGKCGKKGFLGKMMDKFAPFFDANKYKLEKLKIKEEKENKINEIQSYLPEMPRKDIKKALKLAGGDKDKAIILLLDSN